MPDQGASAPHSFLFIAKRLGHGGMTRSMTDTARELTRQGHRVAIHTIAGNAIERFRAELDSAGATLETVERLTTPGLRDAAARHDATAIRLFTGTFPPNTTVNRHLLRLALPIIESIHSMAVRRIRPQHRLFCWARLRPCRRYMAVVLSRPMLEESVRRMPSMRHRFAHLPFGMRIPTPGRTPAGDRTLRLVTITRLLEVHKDTTTLLRALTRVRAVRTDWHMAIIGYGDHEQRLRTIARELDLDAHLTFTGRLDDPIPTLRAADISILSTRAEAFGRANVEAAAVGIPVIASDTLGCRESVNDGVNGLLVPTQDPEAMADAILRLMADSQLRERLGAAGPDHAQRFTPEAHARAFVALTNELCAHE